MTTVVGDGEVRLSEIQRILGLPRPISISQTLGRFSGGFPSTINAPIGLLDFRGKGQSVSKTVTLRTGTFNAPGAPGAWVGYSSPAITLPTDLNTLVSWDLTFYAYKNSTGYGWAYPGIGINGVGGTGVAGASPSGQSIVRSWTNQTISLGAPGSSISCYVSFYTYGNLSGCFFDLTIRYKT